MSDSPDVQYYTFIALVRLCIASTSKTILSEGHCLGDGRLDQGHLWWDGWSCPEAVQPWHLLWVSLSVSTFLEEILALAEGIVDFATDFIPPPYLFVWLFFCYKLVVLVQSCPLPIQKPDSTKIKRIVL